MKIKKRNGQVVSFNVSKVEGAILKAYNATCPEHIVEDKPHEIAKRVVAELSAKTPDRQYLEQRDLMSVEDVQDEVERQLMLSRPEVAKAYILYRAEKDKARAQRMSTDPRAIADYIHVAKYAGHVPGQNRRETYPETVNRSLAMHSRRFPVIADELEEAFGRVHSRKVLPSMRSMQFGGEPIERNNVRMYNCAFTLVNRKRVFGEALFALLSGCGVGFSVQFQHVEQLPQVQAIDRRRVVHHQVADSIEGWADAVNALMRGFYETGEHVEFDYSQIRPQGSPLSTGGKAPGHLPLKTALEQVRGILAGAAWRKLRPIECHDIMCFLAKAVLAGGIRRSSLISIFSLDDSEMLYCKAHGNFVPLGMKDVDGVPMMPKNDQRQMANNSAAMLRSTVTREQFARVVAVSRDWGDPGFYLTNDLDFGCNPCGEIGMMPVLDRAWRGQDRTLDFKPYRPKDHVLARIASDEYEGFLSKELRDELSAQAQERYVPSTADSDRAAIEEYGCATGFQFCNLCEVNVAACEDEFDFVESVRAAAIIGTCQAAYADFPYLGPVTERVVRREALLGVGLTGIMDRPQIGLNPATLARAAEVAVGTNSRVAGLVGVSRAARVTTVKPSGTASLVLGCVGSGIHPHHARRYFRRVTANPLEAPAQFFQDVNPHMVEKKPDGDLSIVFPVQAPENAITLKDVGGPEFMDHVFTVYESWIVPGTVHGDFVGVTEPHQDGCGGGDPKLTHNVSCTIHVREGEWDQVIEKAWANRHRVTAMSFFGTFNDHAFPFAPRMEVSTPADEFRWNEIMQYYVPVDWTRFNEVEDNTARGAEPACAGGACEI